MFFSDLWMFSIYGLIYRTNIDKHGGAQSIINGDIAEYIANNNLIFWKI
jgi:hypothetical protein